MKSTTTPKASAPRGTRDTLCKRLAEEYLDQFARWLFGARGKGKVEKTELDREPSARRFRHLLARRRNAAYGVSDKETDMLEESVV
jgi:hypothetical protein